MRPEGDPPMPEPRIPLVRATGARARVSARRHRPVPRHPVRGAAVRGSPVPAAAAAGAVGRASGTRRASGRRRRRRRTTAASRSTCRSIEIPGDDILTVNVWTPADRVARRPLPVLVFVHGGALARGSAALARLRRRQLRPARHRLRVGAVPAGPGGVRGARRRAAEPRRARPAGGAAMGAARDRARSAAIRAG